ncbi:fatty acyl-AMP ligase [Kitasatospora sp. NPDC101801]|uniref:fatty acyl-AMP ligase n=1 Tax=Kitasatospora sp. NPDC101801 TaxID=3364103 RepID=UPI0038108970
MTEPVTFADVLSRHAEERPEQDAYLFLQDDGAGRGTRPADPDGLRAEQLTYRELDLAARRVAGWLREHGLTGRHVLILQPDGRRFAVAFLGCLYAGAVAVPAPTPNGRHTRDSRVLGILKDAAVALVLTDRQSAPQISRLLAEAGSAQVPCLALDGAELPAADGRRLPAAGADDLAVLQYTSGSTSEPRGVMVTHRNLLANQRQIAALLGTTPESRIGGWLPFHHDMGLVGQLLHPLWLGGTGVLLPPETFVRHPVRWLQAVSRYGITVSGAPDLGYDLCVRRVTDRQLEGLDLSGWRTAVNGAEPVRADTLRAFAERFGPVGFRPDAFVPAYGLAEATLLAFGRPAEPGGAGPAERVVDAGSLEKHRIGDPLPGGSVRTLVSCGRPGFTGLDLRIVDPRTRRTLDEGQVGEVWVRGESVAQGYWKRPLETNRTFRTATAEGEPGFLRTGDLGGLRDGELFITGRIKELLVVAGRNLYPQDIERTVQKVSSLFGSAVVFAVEPDRSHLVVVQEVRTGSRYDLDLPALNLAVRRCVSQEFEATAGSVLLVRPGTVRRTTSGKVERSAMRQLFLAGRLQALHQVVEPEVAQLVGAAPIRTEAFR